MFLPQIVYIGSPNQSTWIDVLQRIVDCVAVTIPTLWLCWFSTLYQRIDTRKPPLRRGVVAGERTVEPSFIVAFFLSELLSHAVTGVALRCCPTACSSEELFTEWQIVVPLHGCRAA